MQGAPLEMIVYSLLVISNVRELQAAHPNVKHPCYAEIFPPGQHPGAGNIKGVFIVSEQDYLGHLSSQCRPGTALLPHYGTANSGVQPIPWGINQGRGVASSLDGV